MLSRYVVSQVKHNSYFLAGLVLGLWLALLGVPLDEPAAECGARAAGSAVPDEFQPELAQRAPGEAAGGRGAVARPRYYSTELGMRAPLLAAVLSTEDALGADGRGAALNATLGSMLSGGGGALRFFIAATAGRGPPRPPLPNVVGFTDTREMLRPFHALKYLADNHLDEYDFFFIVSDSTFVNARRLSQLVSDLSVSQDVYMGVPADDDSHYCTLEGGILLSNSVLRAVHDELDWCVRNSYSAHHHENIGRCVLHAAHRGCQQRLQGTSYGAVRDKDGAPADALADAVTASPVTYAKRFHELHAYVSRVYLERGVLTADALRRALRASSRRHPPGYRNSSWPSGSRDDPGLAAPPPENRWDHLRWTGFNATHAFMPDDHRAVGALTGATAEAVQLVMEAARGWAWRTWGVAAACVGGAWRWEPARALRYRLLLRLQGPQGTQLKQVEIARPLGASRLVPVPYVTESARVWVVACARELRSADAFLRRYEAACLQRRANSALVLVLVSDGTASDAAAEGALRDAAAAAAGRHPGATVQVATASAPPGADRGRAALDVALKFVPREALLLLMDPHMDFNEEFLNRVRMNSIPGEQWYLPVAFSRYEQYSHPLFVDGSGNKPQTNTGRFHAGHADVLALHRRDYERARPGTGTLAQDLARSGLRCIRGPEPGLVRGPRGRGALDAALRDAHSDPGALAKLELGARHTLAKLLLEVQAEAA